MRSRPRRAAPRSVRSCTHGRSDDRVGPAGVSGCELRIVAPDLAVCAFWVIEEEQVVNGDDLGGVSRRNQQWVRGVHDVQRPGQHFDRRPFAPMPEIVQHADRDAAIDDARAKLSTERGRGRSFHELVNTVTVAMTWRCTPGPARGCTRRHPCARAGLGGSRRESALVCSRYDSVSCFFARGACRARGTDHANRGRWNGVCRTGGRRVLCRERATTSSAWTRTRRRSERSSAARCRSTSRGSRNWCAATGRKGG